MARMARVILFVKDFDRMVGFYRDVIGLAPQGDAADGWQDFDAGGCAFALHAIPEPIARDIVIEDPPKPREDVPAKVVFHAEDPGAVAAELREAGVQMGEVRVFEDLAMCDGTDPEGNVIQFSNR